MKKLPLSYTLVTMLSLLASNAVADETATLNLTGQLGPEPCKLTLSETGVDLGLVPKGAQSTGANWNYLALARLDIRCSSPRNFIFYLDTNREVHRGSSFGYSIDDELGWVMSFELSDIKTGINGNPFTDGLLHMLDRSGTTVQTRNQMRAMLGANVSYTVATTGGTGGINPVNGMSADLNLSITKPASSLDKPDKNYRLDTILVVTLKYM